MVMTQLFGGMSLSPRRHARKSCMGITREAVVLDRLHFLLELLRRDRQLILGTRLCFQAVVAKHHDGGALVDGRRDVAVRGVGAAAGAAAIRCGRAGGGVRPSGG